MSQLLMRPPLRPTVEVRVYHYGMLKVCEWCFSDEDAQRVAAMWNQQRAMHCEIVNMPG